MGKLPDRVPEWYSVEIEIYGQKQKSSCPYTCDRCCGRACKRPARHTERCDCGTDCASDVGPFDHLVPSLQAVPTTIDEHDTEEILMDFERDVVTKIPA